MSGLAITITDRGRAALIAARGTNAITISQIGVTSANFTPSPTATALPGEIKRLTTFSGDAADAYTIHVTLRDDSVDNYELRGFALYLSDGTLFGIYGNGSALIMEKASGSMLLLAIDITFTASDAKQITFGDTNFLNPPATTERQGIVELATEAEATTGTDTIRAVTPKAMLSAVTDWINTRFGKGAPSEFIKGILGSVSASALRDALGLKSAATKDDGAGSGLDADKLDGQDGKYYADVVARLGYAPVNRVGDTMTGPLTVADSNTATRITGNTVQFSRGNANYVWSTSASGFLCFGGNGHEINVGSSHFYTNTNDLGVTFNGGAAFAGDVVVGVNTVVSSGSIKLNGNVIWHAGNDGAGSGLDADLFRGLGATSFVRTDTTSTLMSGANLYTNGNTSYGLIGWSGFFDTLESGIDTDALEILYYRGSCVRIGPGTNGSKPLYAGGLYDSGNRVWNPGNDGAGSGLDADMLDGYHASSFLDGKAAAYILFYVTNGYAVTVASSGVTIQSRQQGGIFYFTVTNSCPIGFAIGLATPPSYSDGIVTLPPAQRMNGNGETYHFEFKYASSKSLTDPAWALVMWF